MLSLKQLRSRPVRDSHLSLTSKVTIIFHRENHLVSLNIELKIKIAADEAINLFSSELGR